MITVLLVEDDRDTRELLAMALQRAGYTCLAAANREEALALAGETFVDVVVTDIVLGDDDRGGLRVLRDFRATGSRAPVVVITAYADLAKAKGALNEGAAYLLEKPFRAASLVDVIERVRGQGADLEHAIERVLGRANLTDKERVVARHLLEGRTSSEIAEIEKNSPKTIRQHVSQIYAKCGVGSRAELFRRLFMP